MDLNEGIPLKRKRHIKRVTCEKEMVQFLTDMARPQILCVERRNNDDNNRSM